jgi:hypothetical protein
VQETTRNATLEDMARVVQGEHPGNIDLTTTLAAIRADGGRLVVAGGGEPILTEDGVTSGDAVLTPTRVAEEGLITRLGNGLPARYLRYLRDEGLPVLWDSNVNGITQHVIQQAKSAGKSAPSVFVRSLRADGDGPGIARAILSDRYQVLDNLDVLMAILEGLRDGDATAQVEACDLSEERMHVRVFSPTVQAMAPDLLQGYRSPFDGADGLRRAGDWTIESGRAAAVREGQAFPEGGEPVVFAGFTVTNSELGRGAFKITPRVIVKICKNGLTIPVDAMGTRHVGSRREQGIVVASSRTQDRELALITSQTTDAVKTFLSGEYLQRTVDNLESDATVRVHNPEKVITEVSKALRYSEGRRAALLEHFVLGGQLTSGGVANAVTSLAQTVSDADEASALEDSAIRAMMHAARVAA